MLQELLYLNQTTQITILYKHRLTQVCNKAPMTGSNGKYSLNESAYTEDYTNHMTLISNTFQNTKKPGT